jgi:hypothetical protein
MLPVLALLAGQAPFAAPWNTQQQQAVGDVAAVVVSSDMKWAAVLAPTLALHEAVSGSKPSSGAAVAAFCNQTGMACSQPTFSMGGAPLGLGFIANESLYVSHYTSVWTPPHRLDTDGKAPIYFAWSPHGNEIAYTTAVQMVHSPTEPRVLQDDVIIDVIMGGPTTLRNQLCFTGVSNQQAAGVANAGPRCDTAIAGSVGMGGWTISCWPFDSQFSYSPALSGPSAGLVAVTTTNTTKANDWVSLAVHLLDTNTKKVTPVATATAFQPLFSPDGSLLAYTIADGALSSPRLPPFPSS